MTESEWATQIDKTGCDENQSILVLGILQQHLLQ